MLPPIIHGIAFTIVVWCYFYLAIRRVRWQFGGVRKRHGQRIPTTPSHATRAVGSMKFRTHNTDETQLIATLCGSVFADSEGEAEGALIGKLAAISSN